MSETIKVGSMKPLVSVVVPVYNVEKYLSDCIKSICTQLYQNIEIILVDDGSTDLSASICDEWRKNDSRIKVIHTPNEGLSHARNVGIEHSTGMYIVFVDSDDFIERNLVSDVIDVALKTDSEVVTFNFMRVKENFVKVPENFVVESDPLIFCQFGSQDALRQLFLFKFQNYSWSYVVKRKIFVKYSIQFPVGKLMEDLATTYRIIDKANKITYINKVYYNYRRRNDSILSSKRYKCISDSLEIFPSIYELVLHKYGSILDLASNMIVSYLLSDIFALRGIKSMLSDEEYINLFNQLHYALSATVDKLGFTKMTLKNRVKYFIYRFNLVLPLLTLKRFF